MKCRNLMSVFLSCGLMFLALDLVAKPVDRDTAALVAERFFSAQAGQGHLAVHDSASSRALVRVDGLRGLDHGDGPPALYLFAGRGKGFVLVSGDDVTRPILGYSTESVIHPENLGPALIAWLESYQRQIEKAREMAVESHAPVQEEWRILMEEGRMRVHAETAVSPLLRTRWSQSSYYNEQCPLDAPSNTRTLTGCVATAMAQIMKHWNHPVQGRGSSRYIDTNYGMQAVDYGATRYRWQDMPAQLSASSSAGQRGAVATLMYHCGVSVDMAYGVEGSGITDIQKVLSSLQRYYDYSGGMNLIKRGESSDSLWRMSLQNEISANRPVFYVGFDPGGGDGHAWVCDGYDRSGLFHMNWGWNGQGNGYYALSALVIPDQGFDFSGNQMAVIGIFPNGHTSSLLLELSEGISVSRSPIQPGDRFSVRANLRNRSGSAFNGWVKAAIFDANNHYVADAGPDIQLSGLAPGAFSPGGLIFENNGLPDLRAGRYSIALYYARSGSDQWEKAGDGNFSNSLALVVDSGPSNLELYAALSIGNEGVIRQNSPFDISFNVANRGGSAYSGILEVDFYGLDGSHRAEVGAVYRYEARGLSPGNRYTNALGGRHGGVNLDPGEYLVAVTHRPTGDANWNVVAPASYANPVRVWVQVGPDHYEPNDDSVHMLPVNFSGNTARVKTTGANIHHADDIDMFGINLPVGYDYRIDARVHDSWRAGDGISYTADVLWVVAGSDGYEGVFDDLMDAPHILRNGGWMGFGVLGWGANTGTYSLDIVVTRFARGAAGAQDARALSTPLFRFHRSDNNSHFFTANAAERDSIIANLPRQVWTYEGISHRVLHTQVHHSTPVYRLYNSRAGSHFYTASASELENIQRSMGSFFHVEGVAFFALAGPVDGALPVYRFYSPGTASHFFTISEAEKNQIIATIPSTQLRFEGIAWYAFP